MGSPTPYQNIGSLGLERVNVGLDLLKDPPKKTIDSPSSGFSIGKREKSSANPRKSSPTGTKSPTVGFGGQNLAMGVSENVVVVIMCPSK